MTVDERPVESCNARTAPEGSLSRLRTIQHELVTSAVVTESLLMARNVAVVQALESGAPAHLVQQVTRTGPAAFELAVARGIYHRDHAPRSRTHAVGRLG